MRMHEILNPGLQQSLAFHFHTKNVHLLKKVQNIFFPSNQRISRKNPDKGKFNFLDEIIHFKVRKSTPPLIQDE